MTIDFHHHMLPPQLLDALGAHDIHTIGGEPIPPWKPEASLDIMDRSTIARAILSVPIPLHFLDPAAASILATEVNRYGEDCARRWPDRFGYFASLPLPTVDAAVAEAISALDEHGASGVAMLSNHAGLYQGDPLLDPLYEELDKRHAVAFVHPAVSTNGMYPTQPGDGSPVPGIQPSQLEFGFDSTRAVANLLLHQVDRRFPNIRFVFTHSATCVPSVLHKLLDRKPLVDAYTAYLRDHGTPPPARDVLEQLHTAEAGARQRIRWFYFDTALSTATPVLDALTSIVSTNHILLGTDFPFGQEIGLRYTIDGINTYPRFTADDRTRVLGTNARTLLGLRHE
ncbi:amidohydrolase family protein [Nocardia sp. NPDC101769]|uniref:amidohydrolase family protein n=1 Tax=Nocardia sp. NPDC101769 TaxID=3364333 RepID=UPI0037F843A4